MKGKEMLSYLNSLDANELEQEMIIECFGDRHSEYSSYDYKEIGYVENEVADEYLVLVEREKEFGNKFKYNGS
jgi:hypothetical protein